MFRDRNGLLSSVFSTGIWGTGTSQTAKTAKLPIAKMNARKTRDVISFDIIAVTPFFQQCIVHALRICINRSCDFNIFGCLPLRHPSFVNKTTVYVILRAKHGIYHKANACLHGCYT